jgi:hypothetical protein
MVAAKISSSTQTSGSLAGKLLLLLLLLLDLL